MRSARIRTSFLAVVLAAGSVAPSMAAPPRKTQGKEVRSTSRRAPAEVKARGPIVVTAVRHDLSPRLDAIARAFKPVTVANAPEVEMKEGVENNFEADEPQRASQDPVIQDWTTNLIPAPEFSFEGLNNDDNAATIGIRPTPPDVNGDIGPNHYIQTVNTIFAIYNRAGVRVLGPLANRAPWTGFGGPCETRNDGDPIVLYDPIANRWLFSQFTTASPYHQCIAISQTADPTGSWFRYDFVIPSGIFNDYPKFGVWPDAYYMSAGSRGIPGPTTDIFAFERTQMLTGGVARMVTFTTPSSLGYVAPMPADLDGPLPPAGAPNVFVGVKQSLPQALYTFQFHVDWTNPANSTFGLSGLPNDTLSSVAPFTLMCPSTRNCIPQPGGGAGIDALSGRYVMFRAAYRNFGTHESIVFNHSVDAGGPRAGVRWYELRSPASLPAIFQQSTYAPADTTHRWMGSAAMDKNGGLAVGFSASSATLFPSIYYAGRLATDPLGTLAQGEAPMIVGGGSQTTTNYRWGDYSALSVDPVDDCTFWYTTEYYATTSNNTWQTRIGRFRMPNCLAPDFTVSAAPQTVTVPAGSSQNTTVTVQSINSFNALVTLSCQSIGPAGITCAFNPAAVTPAPNLSAPSSLTIAAAAGTPPGTYWLIIRGTSGGVTRTTKVGVTVTP